VKQSEIGSPSPQNTKKQRPNSNSPFNPSLFIQSFIIIKKAKKRCGQSMKAIHKKAVQLFKDKLQEVYGNRLIAVILYGSYARDEANEESDIDLLILLKDISDFWKEVHQISEIESEVLELLDYQVLISAIPARAEDFYRKQLPIFMNVKKEGVLV
jgi:predicted nucleotidyltransferase